LITFCARSPPSRSIGVAAPIDVPGAIAATWEANVMIAPAEAARAPCGDTCTITGTRELRNDWTISRIDVSSPPGVSSSTRSAWCPSRSARSRASRTWSAITGVMMPSTSTTTMLRAPWARAVDSAARSRPAISSSLAAVRP
jgi:hypothetical protein